MILKIKVLDLIYFVIEKAYSQRKCLVRRIDIEDVTAPGEFSRSFNHANSLITCRNKVPDKIRRIDGLTDLYVITKLQKNLLRKHLVKKASAADYGCCIVVVYEFFDRCKTLYLGILGTCESINERHLARDNGYDLTVCKGFQKACKKARSGDVGDDYHRLLGIEVRE